MNTRNHEKKKKERQNNNLQSYSKIVNTLPHPKPFKSPTFSSKRQTDRQILYTITLVLSLADKRFFQGHGEIQAMNKRPRDADQRSFGFITPR